MRPFCEGRHWQQSPPVDKRAERREPETEEEEEEEEEEEQEEDGENSPPRKRSRCPSCGREYDVALLLPCSHTLCGRCVAAGGDERLPARRSAAPDACRLPCPCCRHLVELPCREWAAAIHCLPPDPTAPSGPGRGPTGTGGGDGAAGAVLQEGTCNREPGDGTEQAYLYRSTEDSFSRAPVDGDLDLREEEMEQSVQGLSFALDPSSTPPSLHLSNSRLTATFRMESCQLSPRSARRGRHSVRPNMPSDPQGSRDPSYVAADVVITRGQYYWEVDVCNSSAYRIGVNSLDGSRGWWMERRGFSFWAVYDGTREPIQAVPPQIKTIGVFLNVGGGGLSFHNPLTQEELANLPTCFGCAGVLPALGLAQGRLRLRCGLPPPPHVFLSRTSGYRRSKGAGWWRWCRDVPFRSVRTVIQKFEELALSDSDSGLVSSFGSSCSTLASFPDPVQSPHLGGVLPSEQEEQEEQKACLCPFPANGNEPSHCNPSEGF